MFQDIYTYLTIDFKTGPQQPFRGEDRKSHVHWMLNIILLPFIYILRTYQ